MPKYVVMFFREGIPLIIEFLHVFRFHFQRFNWGHMNKSIDRERGGFQWALLQINPV